MGFLLIVSVKMVVAPGAMLPGPPLKFVHRVLAFVVLPSFTLCFLSFNMVFARFAEAHLEDAKRCLHSASQQVALNEDI